MIEGQERILLAAQGYSELGMFDEALAGAQYPAGRTG